MDMLRGHFWPARTRPHHWTEYLAFISEHFTCDNKLEGEIIQNTKTQKPSYDKKISQVFVYRIKSLVGETTR